MTSRSKPRVLAIVDGMIPSVELVLTQPFDFLQAQGSLSYVLHVISDPVLPTSIAGYDALLLMRVYQPEALALAQAAKIAGVPTIYLLDDDFSALDPATPLGRHYRDAGAWVRILGICSIAQAVWTFSQVLAHRLRAVHPRVAHLPAIANVEMIDRLRAQSTLPAAPAKIIGYPGQPTHADNLASIAPALTALLDARPDWSLEVVKVSPGNLDRHPRVRHFAGIDSLEKYYEFVMQRNWSIGIAPLQPTAVNDAKTDNKYREYAALGIAGVYSPAPPYAESVAHGITGLYAANADGWARAIGSLIDDSPLRRRIVEGARRDVEARYSLASVAARYLQCLHAAMHTPARILVVAPHTLPSVEIDVRRPFARLQSEGVIEWELKEQQDVVDDDFAGRDAMVVVRYSDPLTVDLVRRAREVHDIPTIYTWDDDFFSIPEGLGALTEYYRSAVTVDSLRELLSEASLVKASTARLGARSREYAKRVQVAPYGFDFDQVRGPGHIDDAGTEVVIGFFGSRTHGNNLNLLRPVLMRIAAEFPQARFELFGTDAPDLADLPRVTLLPWNAQSSESINRLRDRGWSIGLAPLHDNDFNRAKLPTKYRDYAACGIAGVYSRIEPYADNVADGDTGLLADEDMQSWHDAIKRLIEDAGLRRRIAANAYLHVRTALSVERAVDAWCDLFGELIAPKPIPLISSEATSAIATEMDVAARMELLQRQVRSLQIAARVLLEQKRQLESGRLGRLRRVVQRLRGHVDMSRDRSPAFAHFPSPKNAAFSAPLRLELSANLQEVAHVDYAVPALTSPCNVVEASIALPVPTLPGVLTLEVVTATGSTVLSHSLAIDGIDPLEPVCFPVGDAIAIAGAGGIMRFSTKGSLAPVHMFQLRHAGNGRVEPFIAFTSRQPPP